jgi:predicted dehydrogenase
MNQKFKWGIIGTGNIAHVFARGLQSLPDAELHSVASRSQESADSFGAEFDVARRYAGYEDLTHDPDVDAVYISTPHHLHRDNTLLCVAAGKPVLCEKPFAINAAQAVEMIDAAREKRVFLMEAMWTRFLPIIMRARELVAQGAIGEPRMLQADFGFRTQVNPQGRLFNPEYGGGALLDVGVYPVSFASALFGAPSRVAGLAHIGETNVDEQGAMALGYPGGELAVLSTAIRTNTSQEATILGTEGSIRIHAPWWASQTLTLRLPKQEDQVIELPFQGNGYSHEAAEVARCIRAGKLESEIMPLDETLSIMQTLDRIRAEWGLRYPME